jgi:hypothetical protein
VAQGPLRHTTNPALIVVRSIDLLDGFISGMLAWVRWDWSIDVCECNC